MKRKTDKGFRLSVVLPTDQKEVIERESKKLHGGVEEFITRVIDDRTKIRRLTFTEWLQACPQGVDPKAPQSGSLTLTMPLQDWFFLREAALREGRTMEEVASDVLSQSDELTQRSAG